MPALDPLLVCIVAAVLVLIAHAVFALAKRASDEDEPGAVAEGVATILCGLAFLAPMSVLPFTDESTHVLFLLGTLFAVVASSLSLVVRRRRPEPERALVVNRRVVKPPQPAVRTVRVVVPPGADPAEVVRSAVTGPIPRVAVPPPGPPRVSGSAKVAGQVRWTPPTSPVSSAAGVEEVAPEPDAPHPTREAEKATKALDEVENTMLDVTSWLRLDR